ncbi:MAG: 2-isopropylmalate synthase [Coriobacteriia bacterium]|nr:2-isopropylmalate synthase [Coriobacteriia bacterium]
MSPENSRRVIIFDTTLRDGEQSPGARMGSEDKLLVARQLLRLGVDVIEAGFPISSPGDFESVQAIAREAGEDAVVCALARALPQDIQACAAALAGAARPRIHTGIGVSPQHLQGKLRLSPEAALELAVQSVSLAREYCDDVQFYAEDAARADIDYLVEVLEAVLQAGATVLNIPDTTGYSLPQEFGQRIATIIDRVAGLEQVTLAVHCHNDLGLATALSLEGLRNGASQVECTINGLGERAGNAALEEIVMAIEMHKEELEMYTSINTEEIARSSRLVSQVTGMRVQANKAIVGANAFSHSSGIHQDGVLKQRDTYEIIDPRSVGFKESEILLSARSGRAALAERLGEIGFYPDDLEQFEQIYQRFLEMADRKRLVYDEDLEALMAEHGRSLDAIWKMKTLQVNCGYPLIATATLVLIDREGVEHTAVTTGTGPIDASYKAADAIIAEQNELLEFSVQSITRGIDALGEVTVRIQTDVGALFTGRAADGDIIVSSIKAYLNALNRMLRARAVHGHVSPG